MFVPLIKKEDTYLDLLEVFQEMSIPTGIHMENLGELNLGRWREICDKQSGIMTFTTELNSLWENME